MTDRVLRDVDDLALRIARIVDAEIEAIKHAPVRTIKARRLAAFAKILQLVDIYTDGRR